MDYQEQIDKWKATNETEARNLFHLKEGSSELTWRFTKPDQTKSPDFIDINKYYDHYNIQTPLIKVDFLSDTNMEDGILNKTWQSLQEGNANNFIRSMTIEDSGFKTLRLQLIDRTFLTVQVLLERAIAKGSGNVIEDNYQNEKKEVAVNNPQEGEMVTLEVLKQPNGVTNNIRVNYGWSIDDGACGGYFSNLKKAGFRDGNETTNYRWNSRTYANYDPLVKNDGNISTLAAAENSNEEKFSFNLSSQKILTEYNLQTTAWNGWEEFYITDVKSTLTETGIIYDITATGADNMKLNGYKMVQMYAELTAKPKEVLTCLMNNFNGRKDELEANIRGNKRPFYLLWVDEEYDQIQEEKKIVLMKDGKLFDSSTIQDENEKKKAEADAKWESMSEEEMESYSRDSKVRSGNLSKRIEVLKKALGCITSNAGGDGDESYVAGNTIAIQKKFPGYNKSDFKPNKITGVENIHGECAAYYYLAALNENIIPKDADLYKSSAFFKFLEENLVNFKPDFTDFKPVEGAMLTNSSFRGNNFNRQNILSVMPRAFFDDLFEKSEYNEKAAKVNENFGNQVTLTLMSEAMLTLMDNFIEGIKQSVRTVKTCSVDVDGNEFNETKKTYLEVPLNVALLLCPTDSYKTYKYFDSKKVGEVEYPKATYTKSVKTFDETSARIQLVDYFTKIAGWISNYGSDKKGRFNGLYRAENHSDKPADAIFGTGTTPMRVSKFYISKSESEADTKYEELKSKIKSKWQTVFDDGKAYGGNINGEKEEVSVFFIALCLLSVVSQLNGGTVSGFQDGKEMKADHMAELEQFKELWKKVVTVDEKTNPMVLWNDSEILDVSNISTDQEYVTVYDNEYGEHYTYNYKFKDKGVSGSSGLSNLNLGNEFVSAYKSRCEYIGGYGNYGGSKEDWSSLPLKDQLSKTWAAFNGMGSGDTKRIKFDFMESSDFPSSQKGATGRYGGTDVNYFKSESDRGEGKGNDSYFKQLIDSNNIENANNREKLAVKITKDIKALTKNVQDLNKTTLEAGKLKNEITLTLGTVDSVGKIKYKSISSLLNEFCSQCKPFHDYEQEVKNKNQQKAANNAKEAEVANQAKYVDAEGNEQVADLEAEAPTYPLSWDVVGYVKGAPIVGLFYKKPFRFHKIRKYCWGTGNRDATAVKSLSISSASEFAMLSSAQRTTVSFDDAGRAVGILKKGYGAPGTEEETSAKAETHLSVKDFASSPLIVRNVANEDDLKRISTVMLQAVNKGSITVLGDPSLRFSGVVSPYTLPIYIDISLQQEGQSWGSNQDLGVKSTLSGIYVVGKITHQINSSGYTTTMEVMRYPGITKTVLGEK